MLGLGRFLSGFQQPVCRFQKYYLQNCGKITRTYMYAGTCIGENFASTNAKTVRYLKGFPFFSISESNSYMFHNTDLGRALLREKLVDLMHTPPELWEKSFKEIFQEAFDPDVINLEMTLQQVFDNLNSKVSSDWYVFESEIFIHMFSDKYLAIMHDLRDHYPLNLLNFSSFFIDEKTKELKISELLDKIPQASITKMIKKVIESNYLLSDKDQKVAHLLSELTNITDNTKRKELLQKIQKIQLQIMLKKEKNEDKICLENLSK